MTDKTSLLIMGRIKKARLEKGLTQSTLAEKAGINSNYYAKLERGEIKLSVGNLKNIIRALSIKSSDVLDF
jgi:transcriptional regulator with XRE-family HTH domain